MKVAFDHQIFTLQNYGGISRYFARMAQSMPAYDVIPKVLAPLHVNRYLESVPAVQRWGAEVARFPPKTTRMMLQLNRAAATAWSLAHRPDLVHETYYSARGVYAPGAAKIVTVYDMIHELFAADFGARDWTSRAKRAALQRADHIIAISHSTKKDLCEIFSIAPQKVTVVHLGFDRLRGDEASTRQVHGRPFILYVGNRASYKNFRGLLRAYALSTPLHREVDLLAFGGGSFTSEEHALIASLGVQGKVHQMNGNDQKLGAMYRGARLFVYPSKYEGFGLPPLEAMACDCPVAASKTSSMPEIIGSAGAMFDPEDEADMASTVAAIALNDERRNELILKGRSRLTQFSWDRCAEQTVSVYRSTLGIART